MSVYTQLSESQFRAFCARFGVDFARAIPITQGIKNSNWFIETTSDKSGEPSLVFTLFEERKPHEIEKMAIILNCLKDKLPVAAPLRADNGESLIYFDNKAIVLSPKLSGSHPKTTTADMCRQMGVALATLHNALQTLSPSEDYGVDLYPWHLVKAREIKFMPSDEAALMNTIWEAHAALAVKNLPKGLCHLDMFADNTLWQCDDTFPRLTGLLDFTEVSIEHFVMDLAITINDFCTTWGDASDGETVDFSPTKMTEMIAGYESVRPLSHDEKEALPIMLAQAAVTFWLLRLNVIHYNRQQGRAGDNIMVKNPDLMKRLAAYHWENKGCHDALSFAPLSTEDREAWQQLWQAYLHSYESDVSADTTEVLWQRILDTSSNKQLHGYGAYLDGKLVAFVHCVTHPNTWHTQHVCYLEDLFVAKTLRGRGIGSYCIRKISRLASQQGWHRIYWATASDNLVAQRLYDKLATKTNLIVYHKPILGA